MAAFISFVALKPERLLISRQMHVWVMLLNHTCVLPYAIHELDLTFRFYGRENTGGHSP